MTSLVVSNLDVQAIQKGERATWSAGAALFPLTWRTAVDTEQHAQLAARARRACDCIPADADPDVRAALDAEWRARL